MKFRLVLLGYMLASCCHPLLAQHQRQSQHVEVSSLIEAAREHWKVPGCVVVAVNKDGVIYEQAHGAVVLGQAKQLTLDTLFPMASCTKAFTSASIAALVDDELLAWDDQVRRHWPTFELSDPAANELVTLRDLLSHRTGIGPHDLLWYRAAWDLKETMRRIRKLSLSGQFRSSFQYSSVPVLAAGFAASNRYGKPWHTLVNEKIAVPLGLKSVAYTTKEAEEHGQLAQGHRLMDDGSVATMPAYEMSEPNPAGSLFLSGRDVAKWLQFHLNDGQWDGKQIVSKKNLRETRAPQTIIPMDDAVQAQNPHSTQLSYAMGWVTYDYRGELVHGHSGLIDGFRANMLLLPKRNLGIAILCNLHQTQMNLALGNTLIDHFTAQDKKQDWNRYFTDLRDNAQTAKNRRLAKINAERDTAQAPSLPLASYATTYSSPVYGDAIVIHKDGKLTLAFSTFTLPLEHWHGDRFRIAIGELLEGDVIFTVSDTAPTRVTVVDIPFDAVR